MADNVGIMNIEDPVPADVILSDGFRNEIEAHVDFLKTRPGGEYLEISEMEKYQWEFDLYGLLKSKRIGPDMYYVVMRVNGLKTPTASLEGITSLFIPNPTEVNRLLQAYLTVPTIT